MHLRRWNPPSQAVAVFNAPLFPRAKHSNICLPSTVINSVPTCALSCVLNFAQTNYDSDSCSNTSSLAFLCTENTVSGLTLGEAAVQCIAAFCVDSNGSTAEAFDVCGDIQGSQSQTANTLTATVRPPVTSTVQTTTPAAPAVQNTTPPAPAVETPTPTQQPASVVMASSPAAAAPAPPATVAPAASSAAPAVITSVSPSTVQSFTPLSSTSQPFVASSIQSPSYSSAVAVPDQSTRQSDLGTAQIVGISVASAASAILVMVGMVMWWMLRKQRQNGCRSKTLSGNIHRTPPPMYDGLGEAKSRRPPSTYPALTSHNPNQRFYAPPTAGDDKRRSFWRKSIKPEDIGVAVSPNAVNVGSPGSMYSQQSETRLLPQLPNRVLWPAPLDLNATRQRQTSSERAASDVTELDEDIEKTAASSTLSKPHQPFVLEMPPASRRKAWRPPPLKMLPTLPCHNSPPRSTRTKDSSSERIPLTPTYDNGNVTKENSPPSVTSRSPENKWRTAALPPIPQIASPEHKLRASSTYANRTYFQTQRVSNDQQTSIINPPTKDQQNLNEVSRSRRSSISSEMTKIEDDSTPTHESDKQLDHPATKKLGSPINISPSYSYIDKPMVSPIKDLKYPTIPRSASISRQAESVPRAVYRTTNFPPITPPPRRRLPMRPTRSQLIKQESSFIKTETTTSSDGYLSDHSIDWPVPPAAVICKITGKPKKPKQQPYRQRNLKSKMAQLSEIPTNTNINTKANTIREPAFPLRPPPPVLPPKDWSMGSENTIDQILTMQKPTSKARIVPSKSRTGDLYLTVEL